MKKVLSLIIIFLFVSACVRVSFAPSRASYQPRSITKPEEVEVYRSDRPTKPFEEIGTIYAATTNLQRATEEMKKEASTKGGNAIIDIKITSDGVAGTVVRYK
jgi:hypothetical protein